MTEVVDAQVVDEPTLSDVLEATPPSTDIARRERRSEVIRPLDPEALVDSFRAYQDLLPRLLNQNDYQEAGRGKRFVKKSGWRKIATAFDLDVQIIRSIVERDGTGQPLRAEVVARAIAPSGRSMDGDGYCSIDEDRFSGPRGNKSKLENDLRGTATTRAMNRAISGLVGMGEVSAEEMTAQPEDAGPPHGPAHQGDPEKIQRAVAFLLNQDAPDTDEAIKVVQAVCDDAGGYLPTIAARALLRAAAAAKARVEGGA